MTVPPETDTMSTPRRWTVPYVTRLAGRPGEHFDPKVRGLALRVRESGAASWVLLYRLHGVLRGGRLGRMPICR